MGLIPFVPPLKTDGPETGSVRFAERSCETLGTIPFDSRSFDEERSLDTGAEKERI